jgi:hypothetical protein
MLNKKVKHLKFGKGTIVEVIDRSGSYDYDKETGEVVFKKTGLPNLVKVEFENGEVKSFQECALEDPKWFELEIEKVGDTNE